MYAVTALHIYKTISSHTGNATKEKELPASFHNVDFAQTHRIYLNQAIRQQREAMMSMSIENVDSIGLTSVLLTIMSSCLLIQQQKQSADDPQPQSEYIFPLQWLTFAAGTAAVYESAFPYVTEDHVMMAYFRSSVPAHLRINDSHLLLRELNVDPFRHLLDFPEPSPDLLIRETDMNPATRLECWRNLSFIGAIWLAVQNKEPEYIICMRVSGFASRCSKAWIQLIRQKQPRAMVILAHYMAMVKFCEGFWWLEGRPEREIPGIKSILQEEWRWAMAWPLAILESPERANLDPRRFVPSR
jgi:hypothetical protein